MSTLRALEERRHRFVGRADLNLFEVGAIVLAVMEVDTLHGRLIYVLPSVSATKHVVDLLSLQSHFVLELLLYNEYVGASFAVESEIAGRLLGQ